MKGRCDWCRVLLSMYADTNCGDGAGHEFCSGKCCAIFQQRFNYDPQKSKDQRDQDAVDNYVGPERPHTVDRRSGDQD